MIGPTKMCGLKGDWAATGSGPKESSAKVAAVERLTTAVRYAAELDKHQRPIGGTDPDLCAAEVQDHVRITCFPEATLEEKQRCYIDLPVKECGGLPIFTLTGVGWRVSEKGRDRMCSAVDKHLKNADRITRARCLSQCAQDVRVRCPRPRDE